MKRLTVLALFMLNFFLLHGTHNRAGEITYVQISDLTYEITVTTFTYTLSLADRPELTVEWGDNSTSVVKRNEEIRLPNFYKKNTYKIKHTYPGPGIYKIIVQDPNRNYGVRNIPNSVNVVFAISTTLTVNPAMGLNSTPALLNPPYDKAALGYVFIHNPGAFDPDGDSISYSLDTCLTDDGRKIKNYTYPPATDTLYVDHITGDLIWDTPADTGKYNVAMLIEEWRGRRKIGSVVRDMQIEVYSTNNKPPVNGPLKNICLEVGQTADFVVTSSDVNNDLISLYAKSGIFDLGSCPATFTGIDSGPGFNSARFLWTPCHEAVRNQPYSILIKSDDNNEEVRLSDIDNFTIKVLGPSPILFNAVPEGKFIRLHWQNYGTPVISGFAVYRREGPTTFVPDSCTSGLPLSTGFVKIGYIDGSSATSFLDTDNGQGLSFGKEYTYRIVAVYPNGTESKASNEITSTLVAGMPVIRNVSVTATSQTTGSIYLAWKKPDRLDTIPALGPYEYIIYRAEGVTGNDYVQIKSIPTTTLNDTVYVDTPLNTLTTGYIYRIEVWNKTPGNIFMIGSQPGYASSLYLTASPGDRKVILNVSRNVPWINTQYDFFRLNKSTMVYDLVGSTNQLTFTDEGLVNGTEYCYYVRSTGGYLADKMPKNLINLSQITCMTPVDNEPPCAPEINVTSDCDSLFNTVRWVIKDPLCFQDVVGYKIYYKMTYEEEMQLLKTIDDKNIFSYKHYPGEIVAGCYAVSAFDALGNEGEKSTMVCVDSCNFYEIPNVFTPNGDNYNDRLMAKTSGLVERIDFKLFNRSGLLVFSTDEPKIDWDGTYKGKIVSPGVYFYQCEVFERRITGLEQFHLSGFIHIITDKDATVKQQETK
jgi:gliding motility-associated-like protein